LLFYGVRSLGPGSDIVGDVVKPLQLDLQRRYGVNPAGEAGFAPSESLRKGLCVIAADTGAFLLRSSKKIGT
jgi:hypothetical protein